MNEWELPKENDEQIKSDTSVKTLESTLTEDPNKLNDREVKRR